jgi:hypothetical protein
LYIELAEQQSIDTYSVVLHCCLIKNIDCRVLRYINGGALPFKEFSEEWFDDGEGESWSISGTEIAGYLILKDFNLRR